MAFKLVKLNKLVVRVKGQLPDENGKPTDFNFALQCKRLDQDELEAVIQDKSGSLQDFARSVVQGWESVLGEDGQPVDFSDDNLESLLKQAGMPTLLFQSYIKQVGAVAKN